ncbi:MAG: hypothetical protein EB015_05090 [Methylocystaceae bacterium]|nr:hypothetical protein [Methylocystaceae bacterium]
MRNSRQNSPPHAKRSGDINRPDDQNCNISACPPQIIKVIGEPTTADILSLYEKYWIPTKFNRRQGSDNSFANPKVVPPLTVFLTDLRCPNSLREIYDLMRLYYSSKHKVLIVIGEPNHINTIWGVFLQSQFRRYRLNAAEFANMRSDIDLMNQTIFCARGSQRLILRQWNLVTAVNLCLRKAGWEAVRTLSKKTASLCGQSLARAQNFFSLAH